MEAKKEDPLERFYKQESVFPLNDRTSDYARATHIHYYPDVLSTVAFALQGFRRSAGSIRLPGT